MIAYANPSTQLEKVEYRNEEAIRSAGGTRTRQFNAFNNLYINHRAWKRIVVDKRKREERSIIRNKKKKNSNKLVNFFVF